MKTKTIALSAISMALLGVSTLSQAAGPVLGQPVLGKSTDFATWYAGQQAQKKAAITDQFIVRFSSEASLQQLQTESANAGSLSVSGTPMLQAMSSAAGAELSLAGVTGGGEALLKVSKAMSLEKMAAMAQSLASRNDVLSAEPDPRRYPLQNTPFGYTKVQADQLSDAAADGMTVCIIDSGYERANPDLPSGSNITGTNDSGTGNWYQAGGSHGTHVAGTIAALQNSVGIKGILPNNKVNLHIIKVFNESGYAYSSSLLTAVQRCQQNGAQVVNMSLGGPSFNSAENTGLQAIADAGVLLIAAAGNDGDSTDSYPASYDSVMSIAAVDENNQHANFSQFTAQVEVSGPGEAILSTVAGDGRQGYITYGGSTVGDDRVAPQTRFVPSGSSFVVSNINATVSGDLAACSRSGATYSCGNMSGRICVAERNDNQLGSNYPEINAVEACIDAGAAGVVVYSNSDRPGLQNPFLVDRDTVVSIPTVSVNRSTGQTLAAAAGTRATLEVAGNRDYDYYNGTSMATPHVAGVAALAWSNNLNCTAAEVRTALKETAIDLDVPGRDNRTGYGLVQAKAASDYLAANCGSGNNGGGNGDAGSAGASNLSANRNQWLRYTLDVPAGMSTLTIRISGGSGDADLYTRFGAAPTTSSYDCRPYESGNNETCTYNNPQGGEYSIGIRAYRTFSGVTLNATWE